METTASSVATQTVLKAIADRWQDRYGAERVLVYGSVAHGTATEHNDIDLLVVAPTTERFLRSDGVSVGGCQRHQSWVAAGSDRLNA